MATNINNNLYDYERSMLENIATSTLEANSGVSEIGMRDRNTECTVCKQDWNALSNDPYQMKWQSTRICNGHYLCTDCYYRIAFDDNGVLKEEYACPTCRAIELPRTDNGRAHYGKYDLLKLLNADKERNKTIRESVVKSATVKELQKDNIRLTDQVIHLQQRLNKVESVKSIEALLHSNKILEDKLKVLNSINEKATANAEASHAAMIHAVTEIGQMKKKHKERIALMERELIILNDAIEKKPANSGNHERSSQFV